MERYGDVSSKGFGTAWRAPPEGPAQQPPGMQVAERSGATEATRYLCAAAYLDRAFTEKVLGDVFEERFRFVAPSYGVDIVNVIKHCLAARRRNVVQDAVLTVALVLGLVLFNSGRGGLFLLLFVATWAFVFGDELQRRHSILGTKMAKGRFDPNAGDPPLDATQRDRLAELGREQDGNVSVYSGFVPFVGSGFPIGGWSFTVNTTRPASGLRHGSVPQSFTTEEIHDHVGNALIDLSLPNLTVEDRLYVNGRDIRNDGRFLPEPFSRPASTVSDDLVRSFMGETGGAARQYLSVRILGWNGELVVSLFLRFCMSGKSLFVEASYFLLPSLREQYHKVDELTPSPTPRQVLDLVSSTFPQTVVATVASPFRTAHTLLGSLHRGSALRATKRAIRENPRFDYGAKTSIRESGTSPDYHHYFQKLDKEMYVKTVEREILDVIVDFLDDHDIETSDLRERTNVIQNSGVIVTGGSIKTDAMAVGDKAKATIRTQVAQRTTSPST